MKWIIHDSKVEKHAKDSSLLRNFNVDPGEQWFSIWGREPCGGRLPFF